MRCRQQPLPAFISELSLPDSKELRASTVSFSASARGNISGVIPHISDLCQASFIGFIKKRRHYDRSSAAMISTCLPVLPAVSALFNP